MNLESRIGMKFYKREIRQKIKCLVQLPIPFQYKGRILWEETYKQRITIGSSKYFAMRYANKKLAEYVVDFYHKGFGF